MKELNELVELAKEYDSATTAEDALAVNNQFKAIATRHTLLAIAEAFRALEQRAEAAEAKVKELEQEQAEHDEQIASLQGKFDLALAGLRSKTSRCDKAEAKLAELEKQQAVGVARMELAIGKEGLRYYQCFVDMRPDLVVAELNTGMELFTRPAPAINLAEMVPPERNKWEGTDEEGYDIDYMEPSDIYQMGKDEGFNLCCAAILRNIEDSK